MTYPAFTVQILGHNKHFGQPISGSIKADFSMKPKKKLRNCNKKGNVRMVRVPFTLQSNCTRHCSISASSIDMATTSLLFLSVDRTAIVWSFWGAFRCSCRSFVEIIPSDRLIIKMNALVGFRIIVSKCSNFDRTGLMLFTYGIYNK